MRSTQRDGAGVSVLGRATSVLAAFDEGSPVLGVAEIARRSGLAKSTVAARASALGKFYEFVIGRYQGDIHALSIVAKAPEEASE